MRGGLFAGSAALLTLAGAVPGASAAPAPYDGRNPFVCELQQAGFGTEFPHPEADPFCVEYDKTHQNVSELGVVDFLSKEPARVAVASPKCFYFQHDHWTGYVQQGNPATETYSWDGSYFFDKARGVGGAYVENFTVNNQTGDPRELPGFPEDYKPAFGPGRGGVQTTDQVPADPRCQAKAQEPNIYRSTSDRCRPARGSVDRGIGGLNLGMTRQEVRRDFGPPGRERKGTFRYCVLGRGKLIAAFESRADDARANAVMTTSAGFDLGGVRKGDSVSKARSKLRGERLLARHNGTTVYGFTKGSRRLIFGIRKKRVTVLGTVDRKLSPSTVGRRAGPSG
jgi:hypothetical protein